MKSLLLINASASSGSTGRIAEEIGQSAISEGYTSFFAYGRNARDSQSHLIKIGNKFDFTFHAIESFCLDNHGFASRNATIEFINKIEKIQPDIINLHNIHGYYLNIEIFFSFIEKTKIPLVWTLHDCWSFTGHCSYFDRFHCNKWQTMCYSCPNQKGYPTSLFLDRSKINYRKKKELFNKPDNITIVTPSHWLEKNVKKSFLCKYPVVTINNGVDLNVFQPQTNTSIKQKFQIPKEKKIVLGVASIWDARKGLEDFISLKTILDKRYQIVLVGLNNKQISSLPEGIIGIKRTENLKQLAELYSIADVFVNPTYIDNFPTTNIEALACGTPVITYKTGGSPESIDLDTGIVIEQGNILQLKSAIEHVASNKELYTAACRIRAEKNYDKKERFNDYVELFNRLTKNK